jgi:hypothetical protein
MRKLNVKLIVILLTLVGIYGTVQLLSDEWMGVPPKFMDTIDTSFNEPHDVVLPPMGVFRIYELTSSQFNKTTSAERLYKKLQALKFPVYYRSRFLGKRVYYTVNIGPYLNESEAKVMLKKIRKVEPQFTIQLTYLS